MDRRTDTLCENSDHYWSGLWINSVAFILQLFFSCSTILFLQLQLLCGEYCLSFCSKVCVFLLTNCHKTCVINDPRGQTHNATSSDHCFHLKFVLFCDILNTGDRRTDRLTCENNDHYRPGLRVGRLDHLIDCCFTCCLLSCSDLLTFLLH